VADVFEWDETVAYNEEAQYVGRMGREEAGRVPLEALLKPYKQYKQLFGEKKGRGWHLEGPSITLSIFKKGQNRHGPPFTLCRHTR